MPDADPAGRYGRAAVFCALLLALAGLLVLGGTVTPDPSVNHFPDEDDVAPNPDAYVGERVVLGGTVVETEPTVVRVRGDDAAVDFTLRDADASPDPGDSVTAFGTLRGDRTLAVDGMFVREPWEFWYMYAVSFLGGLWVLARLARQWRFDRAEVAFVPRDRSGSADGDTDA